MAVVTGPRQGSSWFGPIRAHPLAAILTAAVIVRIALLPLWARLPNNLTDEGFWKHWMEIIDREGVLNIFRASDTDYVGYHWVLWLLTKVYDVMGGPYSHNDFSLHILVKIPPVLFDMVLIFVVYVATKIILRESDAPSARAVKWVPVIAVAVIAFQPAVLYDSAVWGQTDSAITAAMLGAIVLAATGRPFWAGAVLGLGFMLKPHPVIVSLVLLVLLWRNGGVRAILLAGAGAIAVAAVVLGPWILHGELGRIVDVYEVLFTKERDRLSELAWNAWWIVDQNGDPRPDTRIFGDFPLTYQMAGFALSALSAALCGAYAWLRPGLRGALIAAAYIAFAFYAWPIGSHERYLYPFLGLLLPVALVERRWLWLYIAVSTTFFLNLVTVAPPVHDWMDRWVYSDFGTAVAAVNTALFAAFTVMMLHDLVWRRREWSMAASSPSPAVA